MADNKRFMSRRIKLARIAGGWESTPVGSNVVVDGTVISEGFEILLTGHELSGQGRGLRIFIAFMRDVSVAACMPMKSAAPSEPEIFQL